MGSKGMRAGNVPSIIAKVYEVGRGSIALVIFVPGNTINCYPYHALSWNTKFVELAVKL
jgi:hypothetical protein